MLSIQTWISNINTIRSIASFYYVSTVIVSNILGWLEHVNGRLIETANLVSHFFLSYRAITRLY
jgi:hypothetical protein